MKITGGDSVATSAADVHVATKSVTDEKDDCVSVVEVATDRTAEANRTCSWVDYAAVHDVLVRLIHVAECCSCCKLNAACSCP